jgi:hypothetical protein
LIVPICDRGQPQPINEAGNFPGGLRGMNAAIDEMRANEIHGVDISSRRSRPGLFGWYYFDQAGLFR